MTNLSEDQQYDLQEAVETNLDELVQFLSSGKAYITVSEPEVNPASGYVQFTVTIVED